MIYQLQRVMGSYERVFGKLPAFAGLECASVVRCVTQQASTACVTSLSGLQTSSDCTSH